MAQINNCADRGITNMATKKIYALLITEASEECKRVTWTLGKKTSGVD